MPTDVILDHRVVSSLGPRLAGMPVVVNSAARRRWCAAILREVGADLVIVHSEYGLAAAMIDVAAHEGVRSLHVVHTFFWTAPGRPPRSVARFAAAVLAFLHRRATASPPLHRSALAVHPLDDALRGMTLAVARRADVVVSPSHHQADALRAAGLERVSTVSNVVLDAAARASVPFYPDRAPLRLAWAGRFSPEKGLMLVIRAVLIAERSLGAGIELHIAGDGQQSRSARSAAADSAAVRWYGRLSGHQIGMLLLDCDAVVVSSSGFDNQPMIALEGFHAGRPVIVVDPRLAEEFGRAALLAEQPTEQKLADLFVELATDRARLAAAAAAATEAAELSGPEAHVAALIAAAG
jgi:glycosyltransferase involved in cell wall biosynthesis